VPIRPDAAKLLLLTALALTAFAANSILCRLALAEGEIDPYRFTAIRLVSGAIALVVLLSLGDSRRDVAKAGDPLSGGLLFVYAAAFSFAYVGLQAGTGALILFGTVQATMILSAVFKGERPAPLVWAGLAVALAGLAYLVLPGLQAPPPDRAMLMTLAGVAWGAYSLRGRGVSNPVKATRTNFVYAAIASLPLLLLGSLAASPRGVLLAVFSGAATSGIGYVIWYAALPALGATRAAVVQLAVPILAAFGGVILLAEEPTLRLAVASVLTVAGIGLAVWARARAFVKPRS
jgi:drug/metabolite transporter (DMT)-like permease